ncbi:substrate-binding domain-containing protein [Streptomyces sp. NPDC088923]|uniref:substrate-binding domain-containing protein n=1 Tax=Streptomyces sp. NPDC088923 TaxID=3365913 RepID=UPI0038259A96
MAASAERRRSRILDVVRETGSIRVVELAERLDIPAVTVRRDVAVLADEGRVQRTHGSVSLSPDTVGGQPAGQGRVIGMLVPTVGQYFDEVIAGAHAAATAGGARLVLGIAPYGAGNDRAQVERLLGSDVDGLLLTPGWTPGGGLEGGDWLGELPVPAVLVERRAARLGAAAQLDAVCSDHRHGVLLALRRFVALGHDAVLLAARADTRTACEVRAGYAEATEQLGLPTLPVIDVPNPGVSRSPADEADLAARIAEAAREGVRAVLVHNDQDALQLPSLLRTHGLTVPEDVALIAYDDVYASLSEPPLTAVAPPKQAVGSGALDLLLRRLDAGDSMPVHRIELLPTLELRKSCGGPA